MTLAKGMGAGHQEEFPGSKEVKEEAGPQGAWVLIILGSLRGQWPWKAAMTQTRVWGTDHQTSSLWFGRGNSHPVRTHGGMSSDSWTPSTGVSIRQPLAAFGEQVRSVLTASRGLGSGCG